MAAFKVEVIKVAPVSDLGEGPHWDPKTQSLYYVDIYPGLLHRYDYGEDKLYTATVEGGLKNVAYIIPIKGRKDEFVSAIGTSVCVISWDGKADVAKFLRKLDELSVPNVEKLRINDGKVDPSSNYLFTGTMRREVLGSLHDSRLGTFYNYNAKAGFTQFRTNIGISNGLAWNETTNKFYYIDSTDQNIKEYDYNKETGLITNERIVIDFGPIAATKFLPDGMTIDTNGFLYVACFGGSKVVKVNPTTGKIELEIPIPGEQITSVAFGGPNLDVLFVTSSSHIFEVEQTLTPTSGSLFKVTGLGVKGTEMFEFNL